MSLLDTIVKSEGGQLPPKDQRFPHAPVDWTPDVARDAAREDGLTLANDHWEVVRALHEYYSRHQEIEINVRELHDALDEKFHAKGGIKYLYQILPRGPVAQGCRLAGLQAPAGAADRGFGSVV
jgi:tRNA 2-thiouridine synthesizing protein E